MNRLQDKIAIVTGAASGIGRAVAIRLASEGATLVCADLNDDGCNSTCTKIAEAGGKAMAVHCDVTDRTSVEALVQATVDSYERLDVLVNVAGIGGFAHTDQETDEHWDKVISVNLTGTFNTMRASLPKLLETKGAIVNVASVAAFDAHPYCAAYCASKAGVLMMTRATAMEYAIKNVRINCVCPGGIETPMHSQFQPIEGANAALLMRLMALNGRLGQPEEVAGAVAYLASDDASYVTGATLTIDGGASL